MRCQYFLIDYHCFTAGIIVGLVALTACTNSGSSDDDPSITKSDTTPPHILFDAVRPAPQRISQEPIFSDSKFLIRFSEQLEPSSVIPNNVTMLNTDTEQLVSIKVTLENSPFAGKKENDTNFDTDIVIKPTHALAFGQNYSIKLSGIRDFSTNKMPDQEIKYFVHVDSDNDSMPDWWETKYGGDLFTLTGDFDGDQLLDVEEFNYKTDPTRADTDFDGVDDSLEVYLQRDPVVNEAAIVTLMMKRRTN